MPLTDAAIRSAKPAEKPQKLFDGGGLYLEIAPSGGKWWRLKYRYGGKEKRISLGVYPDVGLRDARSRREAARKALAQGRDPSAEKQAQKAARVAVHANTFEAVARALKKTIASPPRTPSTPLRLAGQPVGSLRKTPRGLRLDLTDLDEAFAEWLAANAQDVLEEIHARWQEHG